MVMVGWFVCPPVSMVTTSKPSGRENSLLRGVKMEGEEVSVKFYLYKKVGGGGGGGWGVGGEGVKCFSHDVEGGWGTHKDSGSSL